MLLNVTLPNLGIQMRNGTRNQSNSRVKPIGNIICPDLPIRIRENRIVSRIWKVAAEEVRQAAVVNDALRRVNPDKHLARRRQMRDGRISMNLRKDKLCHLGEQLVVLW